MKRMSASAIIVIAASSIVAAVIGIGANASPSCPTLKEARAEHPSSHLFWHGRPRCWDTNQGRHTSRKSHKAYAKVDEEKKVDLKPNLHTILWPTVSQENKSLDRQFLNYNTITDWPLLLDVDEATQDNDPPDECCWPDLAALEISFSDRWKEVPPEWINPNIWSIKFNE